MTLPIIFMHRGDDDYLAYSLRQAKLSNPQSPVYLLGKEANRKHAAPGIIHVPLDSYMQTAQMFAKVYRHMHVMSYEYNLFCFQRWFILRDFMRKNRLQSCFYLDSDVMLYTNVNQPEFQAFSMEFAWTSFIGLDTLDRFCNMTMQYFVNPQMFRLLVQKTLEFDQMIEGVPLVSDMVLFLLYFRSYSGRSHTHGTFGDAFFDENLNRPLWAESLAGKKKVYAIDGKLFCKDLASGAFKRLYSLHFQGLTAKSYMKDFWFPHIPRQPGIYFYDYAAVKWTAQA
ncbi:hypothetical protein P4U99_12635 [Brevibacillus agri]|uniref:hypothetical protein n=1 Tax=Brevibacillus agri TaxID=51101 RepID=UPI002E1B5F0F|nr:hypothetical protein [Brevibacillus agri]MED1656205.1 hypothetical protein [Brevibacillus agri]MED1688175.1 hypothetical protein [Brevibacillus agri]MED1691620.1 hypothetical protein [Brevibacillus agri]MED1699161.1 hypothetical protein [Brevibacillus agri]